MNENGMLLATSIAPHNIANQILSVQSWMDCGFNVISCNAKDEIEQLSKVFTSVKFVEVKRDARAEKGRPLVYVFDVLQELKRYGAKVCGIINSDIHLRNISKDMHSFIECECNDSLVFSHRYDIDSISDKIGEKYIGLDFFLFDKSMIDLYQDDGLVMGGAAWDYWMVFIAGHHGMTAKELIDPIAFHIRHAQAWNDLEDLDAKRRIAGKYCGDFRASTIISKINKPVIDSENKITYCDYAYNRKVLIAVNGEICNDTMDSLLRQTYKNCIISHYAADAIVSSDADYVLVPYDGMVYHERFITNMLACSSDAESVTTSLTVLSGGDLFFKVTARHIKRLRGEIFCGCSLIMPRFLKQIDYENTNAFHFAEFGNMDFAKMEYRDYAEAIIISDDRKRFFLWGAGENTRYILDNMNLRHQEIVGIVDSDPANTGKKICGIPVIDADALGEADNYDAVLVTPLRWEREICSRLEKRIPDEKILSFGYSINNAPATMIERYHFKDIILVGNTEDCKALKSGCLKNNCIIDEIDETYVGSDVLRGFTEAIFHHQPNLIVIPDEAVDLKGKMESLGLIYMEHFVTHSDIMGLLNRDSNPI